MVERKCVLQAMYTLSLHAVETFGHSDKCSWGNTRTLCVPPSHRLAWETSDLRLPWQARCVDPPPPPLASLRFKELPPYEFLGLMRLDPHTHTQPPGLHGSHNSFCPVTALDEHRSIPSLSAMPHLSQGTNATVGCAYSCRLSLFRARHPLPR